MTAGEILALAGSALGGGGIVAVVRPFLDYLKTKRGQTDEVAMELVEKLQARIERLEEAASTERQLCDAKLAVLRHELRNIEGSFDSLMLAIEVAPEKAAEVVAKIKEQRARHATPTIEETQLERGEIRQTAQVRISAERVLSGEQKPPAR